jgi:hypothetical protein
MPEVAKSYPAQVVQAARLRESWLHDGLVQLGGRLSRDLINEGVPGDRVMY